MTDLSPVQDKYIALRGLRFHYREWGAETGRPLVLLHGFGSQATSFDDFAAAMRDRYRVLALDQRGHGYTEWATEYGPDEMVADVATFVDTLGLATFDLLGFSMGGRNAFAYTAAHTDRVGRLVIVDIGPEVASSGASRIRTQTSSQDVFDDPEEAVQIEQSRNVYATIDALRWRVHNNLMQLPDGRYTWRYDKALRSPERPLPRWDPVEGWAMLRSLRCPTLLLRGADSDVLAADTAERMAAAILDCRYVEIPRAAHNIPLHNPNAFLATVKEFLG